MGPTRPRYNESGIPRGVTGLSEWVIVGAGPGGLAAARIAAQHGEQVTVVDPGPAGGHALHNSLAPSKWVIQQSRSLTRLRPHGVEVSHQFWERQRERQALARTAIAELWQQELASVRFVRGRATLQPGGEHGVPKVLVEPDGLVLTPNRLILAAGSQQRLIPGLAPDHRRVLLPRAYAHLERLPGELWVAGAGPTGLEAAMAFASLGVTVTLVTPRERLLPDWAPEVGQHLAEALAARGVAIRYGTRIEALAEGRQGAVELRLQSGERQAAEAVLLASGRIGVWAPEAMAALGLVTDDKGFFKVDERGRTSLEGVWAVGDAAGYPLLANKARLSGEVAAQDALGANPLPLPPLVEAIYTDPEVARVGFTPSQGPSRPYRRQVLSWPRAASLVSVWHPEPGWAAVYTDPDDGRVIGAEAVVPEAAAFCSTLALAISLGTRLETLASQGWAAPSVLEWLGLFER
jgi:pyruvate/2-oxoglutarate dehydrogenase complex dihydrolipoamide dehydrogenase (E3) component